MDPNTLWCPKLLELHIQLNGLKIKEEKGQDYVPVSVTQSQ